jgi:hypothetical protein
VDFQIDHWSTETSTYSLPNPLIAIHDAIEIAAVERRNR